LFWWFSWRFFIHLKDEALSNDAAIMERAPIPQPSEHWQTIGLACVSKLVEAKSKAVDSCAMLRDWYTAALDISRPNRLLLEPATVSSDEFVEQIRKARGVRKPLSAEGVQAVREEYVRTVQPMQAALREVERLEWRLNDLVNEACGLTPDEVRLMWATAPPRMPLSPTTETASQAESEAAD
jgi:hypothetical protein